MFPYLVGEDKIGLAEIPQIARNHIEQEFSGKLPGSDDILLFVFALAV